MCLIINPEEEFKITEKDIICYKLLNRLDDETLFTFFKKKVVQIGKIYWSKIKKEEHQYYAPDFVIDKALHSFCNIEDIFKYIDYYNKKGIVIQKYIVIVECIIPKKSIYIKGKFDGYNSYASNRIKYIRILNDEEIKFK